MFGMGGGVGIGIGIGTGGTGMRTGPCEVGQEEDP